MPNNGPRDIMNSGPMRGPMRGPMNGPMSVPMNGPMGGPTNGPMGGPMGGSINNPSSMPMNNRINEPNMNKPKSFLNTDVEVDEKEEEKERMVATPWFEEKIPFSKAAEIGTRKVIADHSVVGAVITTDGSFGEIPRQNYIDAEEKTVNQLKELEKPFVIILNSATP